MSLKRIQKELQEIEKEPSNAWTASLVEKNNYYKWTCTIMGPEGSPYAGGKFKLSLELPNDYPFSPPSAKFETKVYHPNIDSNGKICLDILQSNWSAALRIPMVLLSITSLLDDPNPSSALDSSIAHVYRTDKKKYDENAKEWTKKYAK